MFVLLVCTQGNGDVWKRRITNYSYKEKYLIVKRDSKISDKVTSKRNGDRTQFWDQ